MGSVKPMISKPLLGLRLNLTQYLSRGTKVVLNREADAATAEKTCMVPPRNHVRTQGGHQAMDEALSHFDHNNKKKNCVSCLAILTLKTREVEKARIYRCCRWTRSNQDVVKETLSDWQVVTKQPTETEATALEFALKAIKYVKSNGIIVTNTHDTWVSGSGQTNRSFSPYKADQAKDSLDGAVLLRMPSSLIWWINNVEETAKAGIKVIIQPGGL